MTWYELEYKSACCIADLPDETNHVTFRSENDDNALRVAKEYISKKNRRNGSYDLERIARLKKSGEFLEFDEVIFRTP